MNTDHFTYLLEAARCGSINKAAQNLFLSQPYLSNLIKTIEKEVGFPIFLRTKNGIILTSQGEAFLECIKVMDIQMKKILEISQEKQNIPGLSIMSFRFSFFTQIYLDFRKENNLQDSDDVFSDGRLSEILENVSSGKIRLGFASVFDSRKESLTAMCQSYHLDFFPVSSAHCFGVLMAGKHPLSRYKEIDKPLLAAYPHVALDEISKEEYYSLLDLNPNPKLLIVSDRGSFFDVLNSGPYLAITTENPAFNKTGSKYAWRPLVNVDHVEAEIVCIKSRVYQLTPLERVFLDYVKKKLNYE